MTKLIERNTTIPAKKAQIFSTAEDNQTSVEIRVFQGEREFAKDNKMLGQFKLDGIPAAPRGVPQVEVTFDIDANGILSVAAKDKASGKQQTITITAGGGLSEAEIKKMVDDAKAHEAEDKAAREVVEERNKLDGVILNVEKTVSENKEKLPADQVTKVEAALETAKVALKEHADNKEELKKAHDELIKSAHTVAEILYKQDQAAGEQPGSATREEDGSKEEPIDAEINQD